MVGNHNEIEKRLWDAADQLRANSRLKPSEYAGPVLRLSETPPRWDRPTVPQGCHEPVWPERTAKPARA